MAFGRSKCLNKRNILFIVLIILTNVLNSQTLQGRLVDNVRQTPVKQAVVKLLNAGQEVTTDSEGKFKLELRDHTDDLDIEVTADQFELFRIQLRSADWNPELQEFYLIPKHDPLSENFETTEIDNDDESNAGDVYSLLTSSEDPIKRAAGFQFSNLRYSLRGINSNYNQLGFNGFLLNNPIDNFTPFYLLSGQSLLTRYSEDYLSYKDNDFHFGALGLTQWIQFESQNSRKEFSVNYALTNRNYTNKLGIHYASGLLKNGWSVTAGLNKRWAREGFNEGSFYDAKGAYFGISKHFSNTHTLNFLFVTAPVLRGKTSPGTKEVYSLNSDHYYNSYWGFQEDKKRNSRLVNSKIPMALLNYSWSINEHLKLEAGFMGLSGSYSTTRLDWHNALDPRPDYYQKLPSYIQDPEVSSRVAQAWRTDINVRQIHWDEIYQANYSNYETIFGVNGNASGTLTGRNAVYWIEETHRDPSEMEHFANLQWNFGRNVLKGGYRIEIYEEDNYLKADDLLGADFLIDLEDFATGDFRHPDIRIKNHVIHKGDRYGFDYTSNVRNITGQLDYAYVGKKLDFSLGVNLNSNSISRTGNFLNAVFSNSLGKSESLNENGYGIKSMITWKINGRNYIRWNGAFQDLPNRFDQVFINPQWRADVLSVKDHTRINFSDLSYFYRSPGFKFQLTGYFALIQNQIVNKNFYLDEQLESDSNFELSDGGFINAFYTGLDQQHIGLESSFEVDLGKAYELTVVYNLGDHIYTSRPELLIFDKFSSAISRHTVYLKNFYVPGSAQQAFSGSIKYNFKSNGFAELSFNYLDKQYLDVNPLRRTSAAVEDIERDSELFHKIIDQEKLPAAFYVNAFVYKSYRIGKLNLGVSLSINNLLNAENILSGGFEQYRFDFAAKNPEKFPSKYYYLQDLSFYLGLNLKL